MVDYTEMCSYVIVPERQLEAEPFNSLGIDHLLQAFKDDVEVPVYWGPAPKPKKTGPKEKPIGRMVNLKYEGGVGLIGEFLVTAEAGDLLRRLASGARMTSSFGMSRDGFAVREARVLPVPAKPKGGGES